MSKKVHLGDERFWESKEEKRKKLKREQWIKNVMRIQGHTKEEAEKLYEKINK